MKVLSNTNIVMVPSAHYGALQYELELLAYAAGGFTATAAFGVYINKDGDSVREDSLAVTVHFSNDNAAQTYCEVDNVVLRLLELGEEAVLVVEQDAVARLYHQSDKASLITSTAKAA